MVRRIWYAPVQADKRKKFVYLDGSVSITKRKIDTENPFFFMKGLVFWCGKSLENPLQKDVSEKVGFDDETWGICQRHTWSCAIPHVEFEISSCEVA